MQLYKQKEEQQVELIDRILSEENIEAALHAVKSNKGAPGIDKMAVEALDESKACIWERTDDARLG